MTFTGLGMDLKVYGEDVSGRAQVDAFLGPKNLTSLPCPRHLLFVMFLFSCLSGIKLN